MEIKKDGKNLFRSIVLMSMLIILVWLVRTEARVARLEKTADDRAPLVNRFLQMETRILELEKKQIQLEEHHDNLLKVITEDGSQTKQPE